MTNRSGGRVSRCLVLAGLAGAALIGSSAMADEVVRPGRFPAVTQRVLDQYPGAQAFVNDDRVMMIYGKPMAQAADASLAAERWVRDHAEAFDAGRYELVPTEGAESADGKFEFFTYEQRIDGVPVEFGTMRIMVLNRGPADKVVTLASAKLAKAPDRGFAADTVDEAKAAELAAGIKVFGDLRFWSRPELVVFYGEADFDKWVEPVRAWKVLGDSGEGPRQRKFSVFINAATGEFITARNEILHADVTGTVRGWATPAPLGNAAADHSLNPPALLPIPNIRVTVNGTAASGFTDENGNFTIPWAGTAPVTLDATVGNGRWARVNDVAALPLQSATITATPGTPAELVLNAEARTEFTNAQVNAFIYQTTTHNHIKRYLPTFTALDTQMPANVQVDYNTSPPASCNAFYNGSSTNFYNRDGSCNNTAFSSVVAHEYGHHVVNRRGLGQGAFGEGYSDTVSMMQFDDPIVGRYFAINGGAVRTPDTTNRQYPCNQTGVHACGEIVGNIVWEIRKAYVAFYGLEAGRELVRQQHGNWTGIMTGGIGLNSAHPGTVIEWLTVDDNDGDLTNQTPNYTRICSSFAQGGIACPTITFTFPNGLPDLLSPAATTTVRVNVDEVTQRLAPTGSQLFYSIGGGAYQSAGLISRGGTAYDAVLPAVPCGSSLRYYFRANQVGGGTAQSPSNAPTGFYSASVGSNSEVFSDDFETDRGWTTSNLPSGAGALTGDWVRVDPNATGAQPGDDHTPGAGRNCFVTGNAAAGAADGTADVDNGTVYLTSPVFSLAGRTGQDIRISYWRWYDNSRGGAPNADTMLVEISSDDGGTWRTLETIGPATQNTGGWLFRENVLSSYAGLAFTSTMRVRFTASDLGTGSLVEAAVDDFAVVRRDCTSPCIADTDNGTGAGTPDGAVTIDDLLYYLGVYDSGAIRADVDDGSRTGTRDGGVSIDDLLYYLERYDTGC